MSRLKPGPVDYWLVVGYILMAIFLYFSVSFWIAAFSDFVLMLLLLGLIALIHRKELGQDDVFDSIRAERPLDERGPEESQSKPKPSAGL